MTDKKLTNNEIIKVLECCSKPVSENCKECPLHLTDCLEVNIEELTLDLITCLQAENESLQAENKRLQNAGDNKTEELLRHNTFIKELHEKLKTAKVEAYKECVEKVKEKASKTEYVCSGALVKTDYTITEKELDNIIKETETEKEI